MYHAHVSHRRTPPFSLTYDYLTDHEVWEIDAVAAADPAAAARRPRRGREDSCNNSGWRDELIMAWAPEGIRQLAGTNAD